jgi:hypothetical protein
MAYGGPYIPDVAAEKNAAIDQYNQSLAALKNADPNMGKPTSSWARLAKSGTADMAKGAKGVWGFIKGAAVSTAKGVVGTGMDVSNTIGNAEVKLGKAVGIKAKTGEETNSQQFGKKLAKFGGEDTAKSFAGNVVQTAALAIPGGGDAAAFLVKQLGEDGIKELAAKAGVDASKGTAEDLAKQIVKTKVGKQAVTELAKNAGQTAGKKALTRTAEGSARGFAFGAGGAAAQGGNTKQILKAGGENAVLGGVLEGGGGAIKDRYSAGKPSTGAVAIKNAADKKVATTKMADEKGLPQGEVKTNKLTSGTTPKALPSGEKAPVEGKGFTIAPKEGSATRDAVRSRVSQLDTIISKAQTKGTTSGADTMRSLMRERSGLLDVLAGKQKLEDVQSKVSDSSAKDKLMSAAKADAKAAPKVEEAKPTTATDLTTQEKANALSKNLPKAERAKMGESGSVNPGAMSDDMKATKAKIDEHIEQSKKAGSFSGDIAHDADVHTAMNKLRMSDSAKLLKSLKGVSKEDKKAVFDYREAKAAGTKLPELTENQKALHSIITDVATKTNEAKSKLVDLKAPGYTKEKLYDPESGNHRIALGKGAGIEQFLKGNTKSPMSARSLRTSASSSKARVFHAVTDEDGNRSVAVIKNRSVQQGLRKVAKGKFATMIDENGNRTELGKVTPSDVKAGSFVGKDGKTYKLSEATANEITRATGQKYLKDPLTSAIIDYHETQNALESSQMIEKWKKSPDFEDIAMKHGEGTPPKGWTTTKLPQMQGYSFEPKVAHVLDDIYGNITDKVQAVSAVNHALRNMMVAIPIRHNLNEIGFYFTDRGASSLINPMAYKRGAAALVKATNEVMNQGPLYRQVVSKGFTFMDQDDKALGDAITKQTKSMLFDDENSAQRIASDMGTSVVKLRQAWSEIQHKGVWFQQDVLNLSRIIERSDKNGGNLDEAVRMTQRFNPQYKVPSEVAGSRAASKVLRNNNVLFFGSYHYDQWKTLANMVTDLAGKNGGKAALESADKFGALALGVWATHALIDKGLQNFSGNKNAYTKPFGVLDLPDQLYQMATGQKDVGSVLQSQIFPSAGLSMVAQVFENRDFYTGAQIRNPYASKSDQVKQIGDWIDSQLPTTSQINNAKAGGKGAASTVLAFGGAKFPKNSPGTDELYALKYDTMPNMQEQAYKQAQSGNTNAAQQTISKYDQLVLAAAKKSLKAAGKPVPSDQTLITQLKKSQYYYAPKSSTIQKWKNEHPQSISSKL